VNRQLLAWIGNALVDDTRVDIEFHVVEKVTRHALQADGSIGVHARRFPRRPGVIEQRAILEIVIRMIVSDENVTQPIERDSGIHQLTRYAIAAIDDIRHIVNEKQRRGIAASGFRGERGSAFSP